MDKTTVIYITIRCDVTYQKLLKLANVSRSYSKNYTGTVFLRHGVIATHLPIQDGQKAELAVRVRYS